MEGNKGLVLRQRSFSRKYCCLAGHWQVCQEDGHIQWDINLYSLLFKVNLIIHCLGVGLVVSEEHRGLGRQTFCVCHCISERLVESNICSCKGKGQSQYRFAMWHAYTVPIVAEMMR